MPYLNGNTRKRVNRDYQRDLHAEDRALWRCQYCRKAKARPSRRDPSKPGSHCENCAEKVSERSRLYQQKMNRARTGLGLCVRCGLNQSLRTTSGGASRDKRCAACADAQDAYKAGKRASHVAA